VEVHAWDREFKPGFRLQAQQVIQALRGEPSSAPTMEQAMETMRLIAAVFET
jgi:predicted dehydrogenase